MELLNAYLMFNGTCAEAMRFYESALGGKIETMTTAGESPMGSQLVPEAAKLIIHARLALPGGVLMASDWMADQAYESMKGFALSLNYSTADECKRVYDALSEGGQVTMPLQKTFWSDAFAMLVDRFGTPWMINCAPSDQG
ncbi:MAG: VOC family protein [Burkholderiales bacterium]|nr:VOC family protein [Burkholderiales bacterium]